MSAPALAPRSGLNPPTPLTPRAAAPAAACVAGRSTGQHMPPQQALRTNSNSAPLKTKNPSCRHSVAACVSDHSRGQALAPATALRTNGNNTQTIVIPESPPQGGLVFPSEPRGDSFTPSSAVGGGIRRSGGECYNPRMKARRSSSGKGALRERRRRGRLSRVALLAAGEQERERRIEVAAAKSAAARSAGLPPSELPPEQAAKFRAAVAAVRAGDIPACIVCAGDMTLNGDVPGGRWECPGGCFAFSISVGD